MSETNNRFAEQWGALVPGQQALIPEGTFEICNETYYDGSQVGPAPATSYDHTISVRVENLPDPGSPKVIVPATIVTAEIRTGSVKRSISLAWFSVNGTWRWALPGDAAAAYENLLCPAVPLPSTPYSAPTAPVTTTAPTTTAPARPPSAVHVQVVNGVLSGSLAGEWSAKLRTEHGYVTLPAEDATQRVTQSLILVVTPGFTAEADALAQAVGLPASAVVTTLPAPGAALVPGLSRSSANLVLVIGPQLVAGA